LLAYLLEQSFKSELRQINPLLYFDRKFISEETEIRIARNELSGDDARHIRTSGVRKVVGQCALLTSNYFHIKPNLDELFEMRNHIVIRLMIYCLNMNRSLSQL